MRHEWFKPLINKLIDSYSVRIIVVDNSRYSLRPEVAAALKLHFAVHFYESEMGLRAFLRKSADSRTLIIKLPEVSYLPFDIEQTSEIIHWRDTDLVSDPPDTAESGVESKERDVAGIYSMANEVEQLLQAGTIVWGEIAYLWGKLSYMKDRLFYRAVYNNDTSLATVETDLKNLETKLAKEFTSFIVNQYRDLFYHSILTEPVTIDRVLPFCKHQGAKKLALICMDGMGFQEWFCFKNYFKSKGISNFREMHVFALIPTVTEISRRALFSGQKHLLDLPTEAKGFREYVNKNMPRGRGNAQYFLDRYPQLKLEYFAKDYVGIVYYFVDDLAHHTRSISEDKSLVQHNLEVSLHKTDLDKIIERFLTEGFKVIITADHGCVYSQGIGVKQEKYLLSKRAKRACLFPNRHLALDFLGKDNSLILYRNKEVLGESYVVLAPWRGMFGGLGETAISHGGLHLEEVIVPCVEVLP